jgi:hypothetical protein
MIFGAFTGLEIEKYLPKKFQSGHLLIVIAGAGIGNAFSDFLGGLASLKLSPSDRVRDLAVFWLWV